MEKSNWIVELESADVQSAIIEEKAQLACQLEKKILEVEKLKEENSDIRVTLEEANDENSTLHIELSSEKAKNEELQHKLDIEMPGLVLYFLLLASIAHSDSCMQERVVHSSIHVFIHHN